MPGPRLASAITQLRTTLGDPTAPIAVLTPSSINGVFARQQLSLAGPWIRVEFWTPRQLVESLGEPLDVQIEPTGWRAATVGAMLRTAPATQALGPYSETLAQPGWSAEVVQTLDRLENAGVGPWMLREAAAPSQDEARLTLLADLLEGLAQARQTEGLQSFAELCHKIASRTAGDTPAERLKGAVILGDTTLAPCLHGVLQSWLAQRPHVVVDQAPLNRLPPAEFGLRAAASATAPVLGDARPADSLPQRLYGPSTGASAAEDQVRFVACPDALHEAKEAVRAAQAAMLEGTPLDRIALVISDTSQAREVLETLDQAGLPYVSMVGPSLAQTQAAGFLRLLVGIAAGQDRVVDWYELLRIPGLRLRVNLGPAAVAGRGRWRRILSRCRVTQGSTTILEAVKQWGEQAEEESDQAAAVALHTSIQTLLTEALALPEPGLLCEHAQGMAALVERWCFPGREAKQLRSALGQLGPGGPALGRPEALAAVMDHLAASLVQNEDSLSDPAIRVLSPMSMLGARFDRVIAMGFAQGIFPRKGQDSALLSTKLVRFLREQGHTGLVEESPRSLERRRFAAMVSSLAGTLWVSRPMREQVQDRPQSPSTFLLDVLSALRGERCGYAALRQVEIAKGSRSQGVLSSPKDTLDALEHRLALLRDTPESALEALAAHPIARRLLAMHREHDLWDPATSVPGPWTGAVPAELELLAAMDGESLSAFRLAQILATPGRAFFSQVLGARRPARLRESWSQYDWDMDDALRACLEESAAAGEPWLPRWKEALAEEGMFRPDFAPQDQAQLAELHRRKVASLSVSGSEAKLAAPQKVWEKLPWTLDGSVGLLEQGQLTHLVGKTPSKKQFLSAALAEVLQAIALSQAGQPVQTVRQQELSGKAVTESLTELGPSVELLAALAAARVDAGWWPVEPDSPFGLAGDPVQDPNPLTQPPILERLKRGEA